MSTLAPAKKLPPLKFQFALFWTLFCIFVCAFTDLKLPDALSQSDYLMTFHTAGYVAAHGLWDILYPPAGCQTFAATPFDKQAHILLPLMPTWSVAEYMYMPLSAFVFAPYSYLPASLSILAWQATSLVSLFGGLRLTLGSLKKAVYDGCMAFFFIPLVFTLWIGQVGLVFALLPLALGYFLLKKERYFLAGLAFSCLTLKPQMLVPAIFMSAYALKQKKIGSLLGLACGSAAIIGLNFLIDGPPLILSWLKCLSLSDRIYSDPAQGVAVHLATSLPRAILLSQPLANHHYLKPVLYGIALILLATGLAAVLKMRSEGESNDENLKVSFALGALALPLVVPHLFIYDLGALVPAAFLIFDLPEPSDIARDKTNRLLKRIMVTYWLAVTAYSLLLVSNFKNLASPILLVAFMLGSYIAAIFAAVRRT